VKLFFEGGKLVKTKIPIYLLLIFIILNLVACTKSSSIEGNINASKVKYSFDEKVFKSDIIAEVKIIKKINEIDEPIPKTFFNTKIIDIYSSNSDEIKLNEIEIMQEGNSKWTVNYESVFDVNDYAILFLKKATGYENVYWIISKYNIDVIDGKEYAVFINETDNELSSIEDTEKKKAIYDNLKIKNSEIENVQVFSKDLIINKIKEKIGGISK